MEELRRLAAQYYRHTVNAKFFGQKGWFFILLSIPFLALSLCAAFKHNDNSLMLFEIISVSLWFYAKKEYDQSLIRQLSYYSMVQSEIVSEHKAVYLSVITSHISPCLFETAKIFKEVVETNNKYNGFVLDNLSYRFLRFIYEPEAKNRILTLFVYLFSLIALLTIATSEQQYEYTYALISHIQPNKILLLFGMGVSFLIIGYFSIIVPLMFFWTFVVNPILLYLSFGDITVRFFIAELNRYSYLEKRI